ncbi:PP2C family protein-serine/threonine phosphatase [Actinoplanes sp. NPDC049681]|uniref:PP2C family protein-serine/threonine phosphatase n=1 Tax=Actinoplanes sp. NPDC049681 TaxID=3363905 RepID=UPI0037915BD5
MTDHGYLQRLAEIEAQVSQAALRPEVVCERAAGLLAGRIGCRIDEAHAHLRHLASQQAREVTAVASGVLAVLETRESTPSGALHRSAEEALRVPHAPPEARSRARSEPSPTARREWAGVVQQVLDTVPGEYIVVTALRDDTGQITDYEIVAVTRTVTGRSGYTGPQLIGRPVSEVFPAIVGGPVWRAWSAALDDGRHRQVSGVSSFHRDDHHAEQHLSVRVRPVGPGLITTWSRADEQARLAERIAQTERLGNLGWGEWDLVTDATVWSDEMYRIYERDPAQGPLPREESDALGLPEDEPLRRQAAEAFGRGETVDLTARTLINGRIKHLRAVIDAVRDADGRPVKVYGIIQDVTARETSRLKLAEVQQQLREHQQSLAAEHRLAARLQHIVLPIPDAPIELPGLRAAVKYLPAEQASRVGGDWYHAATAGDGSIVLAVGDVAGHGLKAAATMAQLRHALAALAVTTTSDPAALLAHLNRLLYAGDPETGTATAVIARYDPGTHELTWAQAGHPAPLHARAGTVTELPRRRGPLLGALRGAEYRTSVAHLGPGDVLLLYTDGLVEHRSHTLDEGLAPVLSVLRRVTAEPGARPLEDLLTGLRRANPDDDTCLLAARRHPGPPPDLGAHRG